MCSRHPDIQEENGRFGRHERGVVKDGEGVDGTFERDIPLGGDR